VAPGALHDAGQTDAVMMGSIPFREITRDFFDGVPDPQTFGTRSIDTDVSLMRTELGGDGRLYYAHHEYSTAVHRREPRTEQWKDSQGKRYSAYWWHETVRVSKNCGIEPGDQLVLAYYPNTLAPYPVPSTVDVAPFKNNNQNRKTRGPHALDRAFASEEEFLNWIESTHLDFFQQSKLLVARVARPTPLRLDVAEHGETQAPKLVFGLISKPENADSLIQQIYEDPDFHAALDDLKAEIHQPEEETIKQAIRIALAGPFIDPSQWYGRSVCEFAIDVVRRWCQQTTASGESGSMHDVVTEYPPEMLPLFWTQEFSREQLRMELRAELNALKEMETRKDFLELQVRRLTESISAIESLLGNNPNS
jgi:hypothetical protein